MKLLIVFVAGLCAFAAGLPQTHQGKGCKVFRIENAGEVENAIDKLHHLAAVNNYDFWSDIATNKATDVFVPPHKLEHFENFMSEHGFSYSTLIEDVGEHVLREKRVNKPGPNMDWENYQRYETILSFVTASALDHSDIAKAEEIGKTIENRSQIVIKIGRPAQTNRTKPAIFMDGGIHAREWISPALTTYFIDQLVNNYTYYEDILSQVDLYIVPVANPDGYEYTHTSERMWRKNRRPDANPSCAGVDLNRNFGFHWGGPGSSNNKCTEIYRGTEAFSEPESDNMRRFIEAKKAEGVNWRAYYAIHSYAQMWLVPWGWTYDLPEDYDDLIKYGNNGVDALTPVHGTEYEVGSVTELLTPGAGGSDDWAKGSGIFKYSQTVEVRDTGRYGFILPPEQIIPTAEETWAAIQANAKFLANE